MSERKTEEERSYRESRTIISFAEKTCTLNFFPIKLNPTISLHEKCPYSKLLWSVFSRLWTEYGVSVRIQSECEKMRTRITPNKDTFYAVYYCLVNSKNFFVPKWQCFLSSTIHSLFINFIFIFT